jgi:hypothetical protein
VSLSFANRRPPGCPTDLRLDELAAGDLDGRPELPALREHVRQCAACRQRLESRAADPILPLDRATFHTTFAPRIAAGAARARARRRMRAMLGAAAVVASAAAGLVMVFGLGRSRPAGVDGAGQAERDGERVKGTVALTVYVKRASGMVDPVNEQDRLAPGDQMRFTVVTGQRGHAVVLGLDASPAVTVYAPAAPGAGAVEVEPGQPTALPGSVIADRTAGFERVVAVVCPDARAPEVLRQKAVAALARAGNRPEAVSSLATGCLESSVLLRKAPP